jgi:prepilin-type N-terminal cleavage/methylation domain-containing protein
MRLLLPSRRPGFTLIEVLLFVVIFGLVAAIMVPLLFTSTETRMRQQTIALVEESGVQILQAMVRRIHNAERILSPAAGATGAVLALQVRSGASDPMVFGVQTGAILMVEGAQEQTLTSEQVAVTDFVVRNTSQTSDAPSVAVTFTVSRTIRLQAPHTYTRTFDAFVTLHPDDDPEGSSCSCSAPTCSAKRLSWETCPASSCEAYSTVMECL